jgi:hypothetical protein
MKKPRSSDSPQLRKRKLLAALGALPITAPYASGTDGRDAALRQTFRGIRGVVVVVDVARGAQSREWLALYTDTGRQIAAPSRLGPKGKQNLGFSGGALPIPKTVNVTWRESTPEETPRSDNRTGWIGGRVVGDYTVVVADRIPNDVLDYVRAGDGRVLRIKFRLKDDGVLFAWDVEETYTTQYGTGLRYKLPGGDFLDTHY